MTVGNRTNPFVLLLAALVIIAALVYFGSQRLSTAPK